MRSARSGLVVLVATSLLVAGCSSTSVPPSTSTTRAPSARAFVGLAFVGPLFPPGSTQHSCTASVITSSAGDLLVTAAHCLVGTGAGWRFVPGSHDGLAPYGTWEVVGLYGSPLWLTTTASTADYAIVRVAPQLRAGHLRSIQSVVGGATLSAAPARGTIVTVPAYAAGSGDRPVTCTVSVSYDGVFPSFACGPYSSGTSGAPWLARLGGRLEVAGVIGGLHQGGCTPAISYSAPFDAGTLALVARAAAGAPTDHFPFPPGDGC